MVKQSTAFVLVCGLTLAGCFNGKGQTHLGSTQPTQTLSLSGGDGQTALAGTLLPEALAVDVTDVSGAPVMSAPVSFRLAHGQGSLSATEVLSDSSGRAATRFTVGNTPGTSTIEARVGRGRPITFLVSATTIQAASLVLISGDGQSAAPGSELTDPIETLVSDASGAPVEAFLVRFAVTGGGGSVSSSAAPTDANGRASIRWTLGALPGANALEASGDGLSPLTLSASGIGAPAAPTWVDDVRPIVSAQCVSCHFVGSPTTPALVTYTQVLTGVTRSGAPLVVPLDAPASALIQKISPGGSMAQHLSSAQADTLRAWVDLGALEGVQQPPSRVRLGSGDGQSGDAGNMLAAPLTVVVEDAAGAPVSGVQVGWAVVEGGGSLSTATSTTDGSGNASADLTLGPVAGTNRVVATVSSLPAVTFTATAVAYSGEPLASSPHPLDVAALIPLRAQGVEPAGICSNREFLRRVTTTLVGRLPTDPELTAFLADGAGRRSRAVDRLLASREFADHWAANILAPWLETPNVVTPRGTPAPPDIPFSAPLADMLDGGATLSDILQTLSNGNGDVGAAFDARHDRLGGTERPEKLMHAFTGISVGCARCHDHKLTQAGLDDPRWIQDEAYGLFAFFALNNDSARKIGPDGQPFGPPVQPAFVVDGTAGAPSGLPTLADPVGDRRAAFGTLITASDAFDRGTAHRIWAEIAAPLLDPNEFLVATLSVVKSPQLLQALSRVFSNQGTSLKGFLRVVMRSRLYQLSSARADISADPYQGRFVLRRHHAEVIEQSIHQLTGVAFPGNRGLFLRTFGHPVVRRSLTERNDQVDLLQALTQLNSVQISTPGLVTRAGSEIPALAAQVDSGALTFEEAAGVLVSAALQRPPLPGELQAIRNARASAGTTREALEDVAVGIAASAQFLIRK